MKSQINDVATPNTDTSPSFDVEVEQILDDLVDIGRMWAHHGVSIGRMAMDSSARTFSFTAGALGTLARHLAPDEESRDVTRRTR